MAAVEAITMTTNDPNINEAKVKPTSSISRIWIIPILVIVIGGWMVYYQWKNQGPLITIELHSATGIEAVSYTHLTLPTNRGCRSRWSPYH